MAPFLAALTPSLHGRITCLRFASPSNACAWLRQGAWLMGVLVMSAMQLTPAQAQLAPKPAAAPIKHAVFVTDEWHELTRKDGTGMYFDLVVGSRMITHALDE